MKKPYSLDYGIERDIDRLKAVQDILDKLEKNPSPSELEQMGSYILYGKDENGKNAYQRGEMLRDARYNSYKTKEDDNLSLDALLESPIVDQQEFRPIEKRDPYIQPKRQIRRPKGNDPGDSGIPGMTELWECIDRNDHWIAVLEGKVPASGGEMIFENPYRLYKLKHALIDMRRHQYYLLDSYKPPIRFLASDHPKRQYYTWSEDSFYWVSREEWERRVNSTYFPVSKDIADYETRNEGKEVKWVVRRHTFDWENPSHIYALIKNYQNLYNLLWDKLDTEGHTLLMDFARYRKMARLTDVHDFILQKSLEQLSQAEIRQAVQVQFGLKYAASQLYSITSRVIPEKIATAVSKHNLLISTPESQRKKCKRCGRSLPRSNYFFVTNRSRKDGFSAYCKECERAMRVEKGAQGQHDRRKKETHLLQMQTGENRGQL